LAKKGREKEQQQLPPLLGVSLRRLYQYAFPSSPEKQPHNNPSVSNLFNSDDRRWLRLDEFRQKPPLLNSSKIKSPVALINSRIAAKPHDLERLEEFSRFSLKVPRVALSQQ